MCEVWKVKTVLKKYLPFNRKCVYEGEFKLTYENKSDLYLLRGLHNNGSQLVVQGPQLVLEALSDGPRTYYRFNIKSCLLN